MILCNNLLQIYFNKQQVVQRFNKVAFLLFLAGWNLIKLWSRSLTWSYARTRISSAVVWEVSERLPRGSLISPTCQDFSLSPQRGGWATSVSEFVPQSGSLLTIINKTTSFLITIILFSIFLCCFHNKTTVLKKMKTLTSLIIEKYK